MKNIKEHLKEKHGNHFQDCNFGKKEFNLKKRKLSPEEELTANAPTSGRRKSKSTTTTTTNSGSTTTTTTSGSGGQNTVPIIFLDFTGHTVTGTSWNYNGNIICSPANLTALQVDEVVANIVNEYAPYNVVVTTDEAIYTTAPVNKRMRVIFTESWEWYGQAGGVAFINSFTWGDNTPCFVFTSLLNYNTKNIKEAAAHEVGHTLGLYHQSTYDANCVKTSEYNYGNGVEGPIMGAGYYVPDNGTKWWIGPNSIGCNVIQDDNAILITALGLK